MGGKVIVEMSGDEQKLLRSLRKVVDEQSKVEGGLKKTGKQSVVTAKVMIKGFGESAVGALKNYGVGMLSLGAAVQQVSQFMSHLAEQSRLAGESIAAVADQRRSLVQVSRTSAEFEQLENLADEIAQSAGMKRGEAREVVFDAKSLGFMEIVKDIAQSREVIAPNVASKAAGKIPELYRGEIGPLQAINMSLAAGEASAFNVEEFIQHLPTAASGAQAAGSSPAEAAGLLSVLGGQFARGSSAAERIKAFGLKVGLDERLSGMGIMGAYEALAGTNPFTAFTEEERKEFLGESMELNELYLKLKQNAAQIGERTGEVQTAIDTSGTASSVLARKREIALDTETRAGRRNVAQREANRAQVLRELAREERRGEQALQSQAELDRYVAEMDQRGVNAGVGWMAERAGGVAASMGAGRGVTRAAAAGGRRFAEQSLEMGFSQALPGGGFDVLGSVIGAAADRLTGAADRLTGAAGELSASASTNTRRGAQLRERNTQAE